MIEYIKGEIVQLTPTYAIIESNAGIGYMLTISLNTYSQLQDKRQCKLYVYESIREDAHLLFGFEKIEERDIFMLLISVSGIGCSTAIMILSAYAPMELTSIIANGDANELKRVKGVGAKTAQRIIVDLHDKVAKSLPSMSSTGEYNTSQSNLAILDEAVAALVMLGFQQSASQKVIQAIAKENRDISVEMAIKEALKRL